MAAGALCRAVQAEFGIPAITAMSEENPGVDLYRDALYIVDSGTNVTKLRDVVTKMAALGKKLVGKRTHRFARRGRLFAAGLAARSIGRETRCDPAGRHAAWQK